MLFPFKLDFALNEENVEAVCIVEELPFLQDTMYLAFGNCLFFFFWLLKNSVLRFVFVRIWGNKLNNIWNSFWCFLFFFFISILLEKWKLPADAQGWKR